MPDEGWVPIANSAARDHSLSWKARGLLAELLSYPDGWETTVDKLVEKARNVSKKSEGREAMRGAMQELIEAGYAVRSKQVDGAGKWSTSVSVSDQPVAPDRRTGFRASADTASDSRASVDRASESRTSLETRTTKTEINNDRIQENGDEHSVSLAALAVTAGAATPAEEQELLLKKVYDLIDNLEEHLWRRHLLLVERRRPKIYRDARNGAIKQLGRDEPSVLKTERAAPVIDRLSLKYIAQHYIDETGDLPMWFARPLGWEG